MTIVEDAPDVVALLLDDLAPPRLGTMLRNARKQRSDTRRDVADRVGITSSELRRYEHGDAPVPSSVVAALAEHYGTDLTEQFATRIPIQIDHGQVVVGTEDQPLEPDDDVIATYIGIVARLRESKPGEPIALRTDDLVALSRAVGEDPQHIEARIAELLGCTRSEARSLHSELLRRKLVLPVAGLVTGLAVIAGVGVASATPTPGPTPVPHAAVETIAHVTPAPSTTVAAAPVAAEATVAPAAPEVEAPAPAVEAAAVVAPEPAPEVETPEPTVEAADAAEPAAALPRPVVEPDNTPMGIPANETVVIIQP